MIENKPKPAHGTTGVLIPMFGGEKWMFRVYAEDGSFTDHDILHSDMQVTINDPDAYFYVNDQGEPYVDHSPATLGRE